MTLVRLPLPRTARKIYRAPTRVMFASLVLLVSVSAAQNADTANSSDARPAHSDKQTYVSENGMQTITQTQETERKVTSDGEVEIQRFRSPSWPGDDAVTWEREVRTKKLPDGTIEKEYVVKNPDGANHLTPVQIIREKITLGKDSTTIKREMLRPDYEGHLQPIQKETVTESGPDTAKQITKDVQQPDTTGAWQVVERQITSSRSNAAGKESRSVRQVPDSFGRLADYERREERAATQAGKETHEVTLQRRDFSDTDARQFYLVEHTTTQSATSGSGTTIRHVVTESDLLPGSPMRNFESRHSEVTVQRTEEERTAPDGTKQGLAIVSERTAGDPTAARPAYQMIQQTDRNGYVRQIFIPAQ
jgi:hypothetical protein